MAQSELDQLQEKRDKVAAQLDEIEGEILAYKKKRQGELMAELEGLGLNVPGANPRCQLEKRRHPAARLKPCRVCGQTGHDARRHRAESGPRRFTWPEIPPKKQTFRCRFESKQKTDYHVVGLN